MQLIFTLIFFGVAFLLLAMGQFFGKKQKLHGCGGGDEEECTTCANPDVEFYQSKDDPGFSNVAQLGNPGRKNRFIDKLDFRPERFQ